jgi:hypothetical protein
MMSPLKDKFFMHTLSFGDEGVYHFFMLALFTEKYCLERDGSYGVIEFPQMKEIINDY